MTTERMTKSEYARHCEVSRQTVGRWCESGRIPVGADGLIQVEAADCAVGRGNNSASAIAEELLRARSEHEHYRAQRAKLAYEKAFENALRADDVAEAMELLGEILGRGIDRLQTYAPAINKIAKSGGAKALRPLLKEISRQMRQAMADALTKQGELAK